MKVNISECFKTLADSLKRWVEQQKWKDIYSNSWKPFSQHFEQAQQVVKFENALQQLIRKQPQLGERLGKAFDRIRLLTRSIDAKVETSTDLQNWRSVCKQIYGNNPPDFLVEEIKLLEGTLVEFCEMLCENLPKSESISLIKFMEKYCDCTSHGKNLLISCKKALQRLDRKDKIKLPKTEQGRKGQSQLYDAQKLTQNWPQYRKILKDKLPMLKLS